MLVAELDGPTMFARILQTPAGGRWRDDCSGCTAVEAIRRLVEVALQRKSYTKKIERIARCLEKGDVDGALLAVGLSPAEFKKARRKAKAK
jgi:hypothetical protein